MDQSVSSFAMNPTHFNFEEVIHALDKAYSSSSNPVTIDETTQTAKHMFADVLKPLIEKRGSDCPDLSPYICKPSIREEELITHLGTFLFQAYAARRSFAESYIVILRAINDLKNVEGISLATDRSGYLASFLLSFISLLEKSIAVNMNAFESITETVKSGVTNQQAWEKLNEKAANHNRLYHFKCSNTSHEENDVFVRAAGLSVFSKKPLCIECLEKESNLYLKVSSQ
jgi:hypothetical protein